MWRNGDELMADHAWPTYGPTERLAQIQSWSGPHPGPVLGLPNDWGMAALRGLVATFAAAGAGLVGMVVVGLLLDTLHQSDNLTTNPWSGLAYALFGTIPAAIASLLVGAPAGLLVALAGRSGRPELAATTAVTLALGVVTLVVAALGGATASGLAPLCGLFAATVPATLLSRWVVWANQTPPHR